MAADPSPVLLTGATGTGKEFIAREIHRLSGRSGKLVAVNCAVLNPQLVESQLFGHVRGAFTGAHTDQPGLFRSAEGGTLMLDEIGELPLDLQPKLLRVLQEKEVCPIGGTRNVAVDVRVIAATNRDLPALVESGGFRQDLHARLALWEIRVPSLQRRRADVLLWLERLLARWRAARELAAVPALALDAQAAEALLLQTWPDNLRGMDRLVHAVGEVAGTGRALALGDLPPWVLEAPSRGPARPSRRGVPRPRKQRAACPPSRRARSWRPSWRRTAVAFARRPSTSRATAARSTAGWRRLASRASDASSGAALASSFER